MKLNILAATPHSGHIFPTLNVVFHLCERQRSLDVHLNFSIPYLRLPFNNVPDDTCLKCRNTRLHLWKQQLKSNENHNLMVKGCCSSSIFSWSWCVNIENTYILFAWCWFLNHLQGHVTFVVRSQWDVDLKSCGCNINQRQESLDQCPAHVLSLTGSSYFTSEKF